MSLSFLRKAIPFLLERMKIGLFHFTVYYMNLTKVFHRANTFHTKASATIYNKIITSCIKVFLIPPKVRMGKCLSFFYISYYFSYTFTREFVQLATIYISKMEDRYSICNIK